MAKLTDKCCSKCIDSEFQRCPKFTECLAQRPLAECHEDEKCVELRDAVIRKIRYGNGILLKLTACSYIPEVEIGALVNAIVTELRWRELTHVSLAVTGGLGMSLTLRFYRSGLRKSPPLSMLALRPI